jgi:hypothetical protein
MNLPQYQSHKKVHAFKILAVSYEETPDGISLVCIVPTDPNLSPVYIDYDWYYKHRPQAGGYYVVYEDGYTSYSPAEAFENGYTLIGI